MFIIADCVWLFFPFIYTNLAEHKLTNFKPQKLKSHKHNDSNKICLK